MRKPTHKKDNGVRQRETVSPHPMIFGGKKEPEALTRVQSTTGQEDALEEIIVYGQDNALPLRISLAVEQSPAASSCIETIAQFIKGSQFSNPDLMDMPIDNEGTTLWDLHCKLSESLALFWGFSVNFKFDKGGKILQTLPIAFESCRFKKPVEKSSVIKCIKVNPYFGTSEYKKEMTEEYGVYDPGTVGKTINAMEKKNLDLWPGQIYYYGKTSPTSKFYPKPKYWSAKEAIEADHKLQEFHNEELDNGFFQSVLINLIGDPNKKSNNPKYMREELQSDGVTKKLVPYKTVAEEFSDMMSNTFSGSRKAGTAMSLWSANANERIQVSEFPTGINGDRIISTQDSITKTITIATRVPSILANISDGVSLGSDGKEMQKAVELMQSRTQEWRKVLENFYNKILFPNLQKKPREEAIVEIQNYNPITVPVEINPDVWAFLNEAEKVSFIKKNMPEIEINRPVTVAAPAPTPTPAPVDPNNPDAPQPSIATPPVNDALKNLNISDLNKIQKIVARYTLSQTDPGNIKALTYEQAKQMLSSFGFTNEELDAWLVKPEEL